MKLLNLKFIIVLSCLASSVYWVKPIEEEKQQQVSTSDKSTSVAPTSQQKKFMEGLRKWWADRNFREKFKNFAKTVWGGVDKSGRFVGRGLYNAGSGVAGLWKESWWRLFLAWKAQTAEEAMGHKKETSGSEEPGTSSGAGVSEEGPINPLYVEPDTEKFESSDQRPQVAGEAIQPQIPQTERPKIAVIPSNLNDQFLRKALVKTLVDIKEEAGKKFIKREDIFRCVVGANEDILKNNEIDWNLAFFRDTDGIHTIRNPFTNLEFACGHIDLETVQSLEDQVPASSKTPTNSHSFNVIFLKGGLDAYFRKYADIAALQAHPANNGAVFQLASRFNALENKCVYRQRIESGYNTPFSANAHGVQGEEGALSAAPGGILRMYGPDAGVTFNPNSVNLSKGINLLALVDRNNLIFAPLVSVVPGAAEINKNIGLFTGNWADNLLICFHSDIQVVAGLEQWNPQNSRQRHNNYSELVDNTSQPQIIHQIPVSAFNLKLDFFNFLRTKKGIQQPDDDLNKNLTKYFNQYSVEFFQSTTYTKAFDIAKELLRASYRGTLLSAIAHGKRKVFLTLVGAGVFCNNIDWVTDAIVACKDLIEGYGLHVYLVLWRNLSPSRSGFQKLGDLMVEQKGRYLLLDEDVTDGQTPNVLSNLYKLKPEIKKGQKTFNYRIPNPAYNPAIAVGPTNEKLKTFGGFFDPENQEDIGKLEKYFADFLQVQ